MKSCDYKIRVGKCLLTTNKNCSLGQMLIPSDMTKALKDNTHNDQLGAASQLSTKISVCA